MEGIGSNGLHSSSWLTGHCAQALGVRDGMTSEVSGFGEPVLKLGADHYDRERNLSHPSRSIVESNWIMLWR
jgi:hypothetical protein